MNKEFFLGVALGMLGGALVVINCRQAKELVEMGQKEIKKKLKKAKKDADEDNTDSE